MREVLKIFHSFHPLARLSGDGGGISDMVENFGKCNKKERIIRGRSHILRQPPEGGGGVSQMLTIADKGGCGSEKFSTKGFYVNKKFRKRGQFI